MTFRRLYAATLLAGVLAQAAGAVNFNREIRPLLSDKCFFCHGPDAGNRKAELRLDRRTDALKAGAFIPGEPAESELIKRILTTDPDEIMPSLVTDTALTEKDKAVLSQWIAEGAEYQEHWAFVPPVKPELPSAGTTAIDAFINAALSKHGLRRAPEARRETLIRRATLDLTGLPPTPAEVDAFVNDQSPNAYEKMIDRLLASERFGERMTLYWMDAARYGDSSVMHADGPRDMWPWRDYVIRAFNDNMPFDRFTTEQLAGDLIPNATVDQRVASGFNRNHATSDEGGAIPEELRVEYVVDRVMTTSTVWLALTMECSQCHDHKYDPISQQEYYSFFAFFNNTTDPGMQTRRGNQSPVVEVPTEEQEQKLKDLRAGLAAAKKAFNAHRAAQLPAMKDWLATFQGKLLPEPSGLSLHFPLATEPTNSVTDTISGEVLQLAGNATPVSRIPGESGLKFDGKSHYELGKREIGVEFDKGFTFAAWVKSDGKGSSAIFSKMDVKQAYRGFDFWQQGRNIGTHIINSWPNNALKVVSKNQFPPNKWTHLVVTYDGSRKPAGVKIYIDGKLSPNKVEKEGLKATIATDQPFRIGTRGGASPFKGELDDLRIYERALSTTELARLGSNTLGKAFAKPESKRNAKDKKLLEDYYFETQDTEYPKLLAARERAQREESALKAKITTCMIMQDNMAKPRMTYVLNRGQYNKPVTNEVMLAGVPAALGDLPKDAPRNRLGLAQWLTSPDHPLTSRVAINRLWGLFFGDGIVTTQGDFGNQGAVPSHPELLDWLAVDFVEHGWDLKRAIKQMLMSATYRQSSRATDRELRVDPENRFYARGPRFRLQGEFIRDQALAIAGLLNGPVGGPGVKPYQPPNIWNEVSLSGNVRYAQDKGQKLYRRSMYTYWKRSAPMPNMLIFDAPTREKCVVKRPRTNTPLQALVTLNDPQFVEAGRAFAERLIKEGGDTIADRINSAFKLALARPANSRELAVLETTLNEQLEQFRKTPDRAKEYLGVGESKRDESIDVAEHAAWTVVAQLILNLDELLTRG